jgi:hypothetical protein
MPKLRCKRGVFLAAYRDTVSSPTMLILWQSKFPARDFSLSFRPTAGSLKPFPSGLLRAWRMHHEH